MTAAMRRERFTYYCPGIEKTAISRHDHDRSNDLIRIGERCKAKQPCLLFWMQRTGAVPVFISKTGTVRRRTRSLISGAINLPSIFYPKFLAPIKTIVKISLTYKTAFPKLQSGKRDFISIIVLIPIEASGSQWKHLQTLTDGGGNQTAWTNQWHPAISP